MRYMESGMTTTKMNEQRVPARNPDTRRLARANLASGIGAGLLGLSTGLLFHDELLPYFPGILVFGLALHALGMSDKHRIEKRKEESPAWWMRTLYAVCWVGLAALAAYAVFEGVKA
jgi:hypothetical protein